MKRLMLAVLACGMASAQTPSAPNGSHAGTVVEPPKPLAGSIAGHPDWPRAKAADVNSVDHILAAVYDVISGPAGQARDWKRMRSLFVPDARLIPIRPARNGAGADVVILTIDGYIERSSGTMTTSGFFERGLHNEIEQFGNMVQVWSTYESRHAATDPKPFARGINSFQLLKDGDRYWVVQIMWESERPGTPIPEKYLGSSN